MFTALRAGLSKLGAKFMRAIGATPPPKPPMSAAQREVLEWAGKEGADGGAQYMQKQIAETAKQQGKDGSWWKPSGKTLVSIAIGVGVGLLLPGVGFAGQLIVSAVVEKTGEAAVGVLTAPAPTEEPTPKPTADPTPEPRVIYEDDPAPAQQHEPQPVQTQSPGTVVVVTNTTPAPDSHTESDVDVEQEEQHDQHEDPHEENCAEC